MGSSVKVTDADFEAQVLKSTEPVLVDFWAEWCGPCKALSPVIDELATEMQGRIKIVKVNVDEAPDAPSRYHVRGIPTLILFKDGKVVDQRVGGAPKDQLKKWIEGKV